nr:mechanosensitive ion channel family protein [Alphaproteobacteria bacterium]
CLIIFVTIVLFKIFNEFTSTILEKAENTLDESRMKIETFVPILSVAFNVVLFFTATLIGLSNLGIDIAPILAPFALLSAGVGLAAKDIIQSFLQGIILLFEKDLYIGEEIKVNGVCGTVEKLSARVIHLRDVSGSVHIIPYNMVNTITNNSKDYVNCIYELPLDSNANVGEVSEIIKNIINELKDEEGFSDAILSGPVIFGLKPFDLTGITLKWSVQVRPGLYSKILKFSVYTKLKEEFRKRNIAIPVSNTVVSLH